MSNEQDTQGAFLREDAAAEVFETMFEWFRAFAARQNAYEIVLDQLLYAIASRMDALQRREFLTAARARADDALQDVSKVPLDSAGAKANALIIANLTHASVGLLLDRLERRLSPGEPSRREH